MAKLKVQRQDHYTTCEHPNPRQCHAIVITDPRASGPRHVHRYWMWHLVDPETGPTDDGPFWSAREAREFRDATQP